MNILRRISGYLSKLEKRKALVAHTFIFIGLLTMALGACQFSKQSMEGPAKIGEGAERLQQEVVNLPKLELHPLPKLEPLRRPEFMLHPLPKLKPLHRPKLEPLRRPELELHPLSKLKPLRRPELELHPLSKLKPLHRPELELHPLPTFHNHSRVAPKMKNKEVVSLSPVDRILHSMPSGNIAFNAPTSMNLDEIAHIQLLLGIKQTIEELKQYIKVEIEKKHLSGDIEEASIKVAPLIMQAHLEGQSFGIKSITPEEQPISSEITTVWLWEIKPKSAGICILSLTLNAKLPIEGNSTYRTIRTFKKEIRVEVARLQQAETFIKDNWQWLCTAIFFPIGVWLWSKRGSPSATKVAHLSWRQKINKQKDSRH